MNKIVKGLLLYIAIGFLLVGTSHTTAQFGLVDKNSIVVAQPAPEPTPAPQVKTREEVRKDFRKALLSASREAVRKGTISRVEALRIRIASFSPAFLERAQEMCVVQMVFSGENQDEIPFNEDGTVDLTAIDWDGLATFLERILPLILELLLSLGLGG